MNQNGLKSNGKVPAKVNDPMLREVLEKIMGDPKLEGITIEIGETVRSHPSTRACFEVVKNHEGTLETVAEGGIGGCDHRRVTFRTANSSYTPKDVLAYLREHYTVY
ncbi:hypothetical protein J4453_00500 [Candidatus Woesearchaeota archaeon]|nr:hypothetical protein [Candidatus Woesearchaeota archaeon]